MARSQSPSLTLWALIGFSTLRPIIGAFHPSHATPVRCDLAVAYDPMKRTEGEEACRYRRAEWSVYC